MHHIGQSEHTEVFDEVTLTNEERDHLYRLYGLAKDLRAQTGRVVSSLIEQARDLEHEIGVELARKHGYETAESCGDAGYRLKILWPKLTVQLLGKPADRKLQTKELTNGET